MANPILPAGQRMGRSFGESSDPVERARRQDEERRIREDDEHFRRTGENRRPVAEYSPLVDDDLRSSTFGDIHVDIADDGDDYDETILPYHINSHHTTDGDWAEDNPTRILGDNPRQNRRPNVASRNEREAYLDREKQKQDVVQKELENKNRQKFNNAISGLKIDDE